MEGFTLSIINKVIVTSQLENGDTIDVSVKAIDKALTSKEKSDLCKRIKNSIIPHLDDTLYMKVRLTRDRKKDNWNKIKTIEELMTILDNIFE